MTTPGFLGTDPEKLRALGQQLTSSATTIHEVQTRADKAVSALDWFGADAGSFQNAWSTSYRQMLVRITEALRTAAQSARTQAQQQDQASGTGGGSGSGGVASSGAEAGAGAGAGGTVSAGASGQVGAAGSTGQLGDLSARHESNGSSQTISTGQGDPLGGISYGKYQISTKTGTAAEFVKWLDKNNSPYADRLEGLKPGSAEFAAAWKGIAAGDPDGFAKTQFDFIKETHFDPAMTQIERKVPGFSLEGRSPVLADTLFSTAVQHRNATDEIVQRALAGKDPSTMTDAQIISAIYDERGRGNGSVYFRSSPVSTQHSVAARFVREKAEALAALGQ